MTDSPAFYEERIRHLEAARQQAQEKIEFLTRTLTETVNLAHEQRQQAIDALREIASKTAEPPTSFGVRELSQAHHIARAALVKLGEKP